MIKLNACFAVTASDGTIHVIIESNNSRLRQQRIETPYVCTIGPPTVQGLRFETAYSLEKDV